MIDHRSYDRLLLAAQVLALATTAVAQSLTGHASVVVGDTLEMGSAFAYLA